MTRARVDLGHPLTHYQLARLRIAAVDVLKGWGKVGDDGKWRQYDMAELRDAADRMAAWATNARKIIETGEIVEIGSEADLYVGIDRAAWHRGEAA